MCLLYCRYLRSLFLIYASVIFFYSATLQVLSIILKRKVTSNLVIRLQEDPSPICPRRGLEEAAHNVASNVMLEQSVRTNLDNRISKFYDKQNIVYLQYF